MADIIQSYIVRPEKHVDERVTLIGSELEHGTKLFNQLNAVYSASDDECNISISFNMNQVGQQQNDARDLLVQFIAEPSLNNSIHIADRLRLNTTRRSGLGLFFLMLGESAGQPKLVLSRYPVDTGILADESDGELDVQLVERVFMKNRMSYKSVVYKNLTPTSNVWDGFAVDKQINSLTHEVSEYWIKQFLLSDFRETGAAGTKRLANTIRKAMKELEESEESDASFELLPLLSMGSRFANQAVSINGIMNRYNLSQEARDAIIGCLSRPDLAGLTFNFEQVIYEREIRLRLMKLDSGAYIAAPAPDFDDIISPVGLDGGRPTGFRVDGRILEQTIRKKI